MNLTCPNCGARFKIKDDALGTKGRKVKCGKCDHRWHAMPEGAAAAPAAAAAARAPSAPADPTEAPPPPPPPPPVADSTEAPPPPPPPIPQATAAADDDYDDEDDYDDDDYEEGSGVSDAMRADPPPIPPESSFVPRDQSAQARSGRSGGTMKYWVLLALILIGSTSSAFVWRDSVVHFFPAANKVFMMVGFPANTLGYGLKIFEPKTFLDVKDKKRILGVTGQIMNETGKIIEVPLLKAVLIDSKGGDISSWTFEAKEPRILPGEKVDYETANENPPRGVTGLRITFTLAEEEAMNGKMGGEKMMEKPQSN